MEQKVFYFNGERSNIAKDINNLISEGWTIKTITAMGSFSILILAEKTKEGN